VSVNWMVMKGEKLLFYFLPVLFSVGRSSDFVAFVRRLNIPSGTLRTFTGCCSEDAGWVDGGSFAVVGVAVVFCLGFEQHSSNH